MENIRYVNIAIGKDIIGLGTLEEPYASLVFAIA
jgi:hypothetical protein